MPSGSGAVAFQPASPWRSIAPALMPRTRAPLLTPRGSGRPTPQRRAQPARRRARCRAIPRRSRATSPRARGRRRPLDVRRSLVPGQGGLEVAHGDAREQRLGRHCRSLAGRRPAARDSAAFPESRGQAPVQAPLQMIELDAAAPSEGLLVGHGSRRSRSARPRRTPASRRSRAAIIDRRALTTDPRAQRTRPAVARSGTASSPMPAPRGRSTRARPPKVGADVTSPSRPRPIRRGRSWIPLADGRSRVSRSAQAG